ncbi:MAG: SDR family oxidoreductase [Euryarchaeota archaeon]|nr:SDR family oxidoreductase [Euryarchaeota archaeon]MDE1838026.1 SDR family oxidoreductase [Euryarchaeota archaeon]MDE1880119.1 SDR family oxidoreductase [Euryarchaeota archaeon]MDE2045043.1 SDR family oxidoreductase [Thermoplasmata archaeon]
MAPPRAHALVTGAATGIGRATALLLAGRGDAIGVHYRSHEAEARALVDEIVRDGGEAFLVRADLTRTSELTSMVEEVSRHFPSLESLVLNAGEYPRRKLADLSEEEFERTLRTNLWAPYALTRRLLPLLRSASPAPARLVVVSSVLAFNGSEHGADYASSKAGLLGLARSLARELAPDILVNVVAPGTIDTAIMAHESAQQKAERGRRIPLGRIGEAREVAEAVAFLTSPSASYMTGTTVHVNGGLRMD